MHGAGMVGDLLILGLYMIGAVIWMCFWLLCVTHRRVLFGPMTALKWLALVATCLFATAIGLYLAGFETFGRSNGDWWLVLIGALSPIIGIQYIRLKIQ